jgi:cobalt-zinc-cadmium efflux system membrane fusion protein
MKKISLMIFISAILLSCATENKESTDNKKTVEEKPIESIVELNPQQIKTLGITSSKAEQKAMRTNLELNGSINVPPQYTVSINAPFGGFVKNLYVQEGNPVKKGQLLAVIQNPDYISLQQEYLENKSQFIYLDAEYKRQEMLAAEQINAAKILQKAKAELELVKAKLAGQRAKLQLLGIDISRLELGEISSSVNLTSSINGYVTSVKTNLGAFVGISDVILEMADLEHIYAELEVYEKDLSKLQTGQKVGLSLVNEQKERRGSIKVIGRKVNEDRTLHVYCAFDRVDQNLRPGLFLKASVEIQEQNAVAVPESAIVSFNGNKYVFVNNSGNRFEMKQVETGIEDNGFVEIKSGIQVSDIIVDKGAFQLLATLKNKEE